MANKQFGIVNCNATVADYAKIINTCPCIKCRTTMCSKCETFAIEKYKTLCFECKFHKSR